MKAYEVITERIIEKLNAGVVPWHQPWSGPSRQMPANYVTRKQYRGLNIFLTAMQGYDCPYWLTFKQCEERGAFVKKGEKGTPIVFWKMFERSTTNEKGESEIEHIPMMRYYTVFNLRQTSLGDEYNPGKVDTKDNNILASCEKVIAEYHLAPTIQHEEQRAYYRPSSDLINMPLFNTFSSPEEYYSTLFHEMTHSTGHAERLNRYAEQKNHNFGSQDYSKEELIAEMGSAMLCGHAGIENKTIDNSAAYIHSWLRNLQDDKKMVILAAAKAQRSCDYILNVKHDAKTEEQQAA